MSDFSFEIFFCVSIVVIFSLAALARRIYIQKRKEKEQTDWRQYCEEMAKKRREALEEKVHVNN